MLSDSVIIMFFLLILLLFVVELYIKAIREDFEKDYYN